MKHMASVSGGKCSGAMVLRMLQEGMQIDELVFFKSGWDFPIMLKNLKVLKRITGLPLTILKPRLPFERLLYKEPIIRKRGEDKGKVYRHGHGWPAFNRRWDDREMINTLNAHCGHSIHYIGYPFERKKKAKTKDRSVSPLLDGVFDVKKKYEDVIDKKIMKNTRYMLVEWGMDGTDCLRYCQKNGMDYGHFYDHRERAGTYCSPLQSMASVRLLRKEEPKLWKHMLYMDSSFNPRPRTGGDCGAI